MRQADWGRLGEMDRNHGFFMLFPGCPKENDGKSPRNFQDQGGSSRMTSHGNPWWPEEYHEWRNQVLEHLDPEPVIKAHADWIWFLGNSWDMEKALKNNQTGWWFGTFWFFFPSYWGCHHPNWRSPSIIFQRGRLKPATRKCWFVGFVNSQSVDALGHDFLLSFPMRSMLDPPSNPLRGFLWFTQYECTYPLVI